MPGKVLIMQHELHLRIIKAGYEKKFVRSMNTLLGDDSVYSIPFLNEVSLLILALVFTIEATAHSSRLTSSADTRAIGFHCSACSDNCLLMFINSSPGSEKGQRLAIQRSCSKTFSMLNWSLEAEH